MTVSIGVPEIGQLIDSKYEIGKELGRGSAGIVYEATNVQTRERVAIKWLYPSLAANKLAAERFIREAQVAGRVKHPNVVRVQDSGEHGDSLYLVMELLEGQSLTSFLSSGPHPAAAVVRLAIAAMNGVAAAHAIGVVHRDLKPDNIFLERIPGGYTAKVLDFGISKLTGPEAADANPLTAAGAIVGTPYYMAPEQIVNSKEVDVRADVYGLGVILYQGLSSELPYDSESLHKLFLAIIQGGARHVCDVAPYVDRGLGDIVMRAIALSPNDRFASMAPFIEALEPFGHDEPTRIVPQASLPPPGASRTPQQGARSPEHKADEDTEEMSDVSNSLAPGRRAAGAPMPALSKSVPAFRPSAGAPRRPSTPVFVRGETPSSPANVRPPSGEVSDTTPDGATLDSRAKDHALNGAGPRASQPTHADQPRIQMGAQLRGDDTAGTLPLERDRNSVAEHPLFGDDDLSSKPMVRKNPTLADRKAFEREKSRGRGKTGEGGGAGILRNPRIVAIMIGVLVLALAIISIRACR